MKKLSELSNDTMLTVKNRHVDFSVMSKEDFLDSSYFLDYPDKPFPAVTVAQETYPTFNLEGFLEYMGEEDCYEGWVDDVYNSIIQEPVAKEFKDKLEQIFTAHPTYWEGESVLIDITLNDSIELRYEKVYSCPNDMGGEQFDELDYVPYCKKCGEKLDDLSKPNYCSNCGARLNWREVKNV